MNKIYFSLENTFDICYVQVKNINISKCLQIQVKIVFLGKLCILVEDYFL